VDKLKAYLSGKGGPDVWVPADWFHDTMVKSSSLVLPYHVWGGVQHADQRPPRPLLFLALATNNHDAVQTLLQAQANVDVRDEDHNTLLHLFARGGSTSVEASSTLLNAGADQQATDADGHMPIHRAIFAASTKAPLEAGTTQGGATYSSVEVDPGVKCFVKAAGRYQHVVNARTVNRTAETPLHIAVRNRDPTTVRYLVTRGGADPEARDGDGNTALHSVIEDEWKTDYAVIDALVNNKKGSAMRVLEATNASGATPFKHSLQHGRFKVAMELVRLGANSGYTDDQGASLLHLLTANGNFYALQDQLKASFPAASGLSATSTLLAAKNNAGDTPLHEAIRLQQHKFVQVLLHKATTLLDATACANLLNAQNNQGQTPLHVAVETHGCEKLVDRLLKLSTVNVNAASHTDGSTPLHVAASLGRCAIISKLLADRDPGCNACDVTAGNHHGATALHVAAYEGQKSVVKQLCRHVERVFPHGTAANWKNRVNGQSALHYAIRAPVLRVDIVKVLIHHHGGNPNQVDTQDNTPFHYACKREKISGTTEGAAAKDYKWEAINVMITHNARLDAQNREGITPIDLILALHPYTVEEQQEHREMLQRVQAQLMSTLNGLRAQRMMMTYSPYSPYQGGYYVQY